MISLLNARKSLANLRKLVRGAGDWDTPDINKLPDPPVKELAKELRYTPPIDPKLIEEVLAKYGVKAAFKDYHIGSSVTTYELQLPIGTRFGCLERFREDIARDLSQPSLRIIKTINDSSLIGLEVENSERYTVYFKKLYKGLPAGFKLPMVLGEDTYGNSVYEDLAVLPHMLVAGQTGSGKSVFLNTTLATLICNKSPEELRLLIVDPKRVEFSAYKNVPHLLRPIACDIDAAYDLLDFAVAEMERRFQLFEPLNVKKITDYNAKAKEKLPYIVFIVDEFADLMVMGGKGKVNKAVEGKICRIATKARAVGIHMILATQRPDANAVTGQIRSNLPAKVAFAVGKSVESRIILDENGAETLIGNGDMLYRNPNARSEYLRLRRIQAPLLSDSDVEAILS